jgi:uncharacterized membrane protein
VPERPQVGATSSSSEPGTAARHRVVAVDALRGFVMVIMALDHVREFFHAAALQFQPEDVTRTTAAIFFTRWITHICAPTFMFTAGIGAYFWLGQGRSRGELSKFLAKRGLWLILLELTVLRLAFNFSLTEGPVILTILWALGASMVVLALLIHLPARTLAIVSILVIALHNLADPISAAKLGQAGWIWRILHQQGPLPIPGVVVIVAYPLMPWFAVMAAGFSFGPVLEMEPARRQAWLVRIGLGLIAAFLVIRSINIYGDPQRWSPQLSGGTVLSFLRCIKYPPSLDFLLMTLGPALLILAYLYRNPVTRRNPLAVIGRVPLFYFLGHLYLLHALAVVFAWLRFGTGSFLFHPLPPTGGPFAPYPPNYGYPLWAVYCVWILVVVLMYPLCLRFGRIKDTRRSAWLSYL